MAFKYRRPEVSPQAATISLHDGTKATTQQEKMGIFVILVV
jgi:hypothetical protein